MPWLVPRVATELRQQAIDSANRVTAGVSDAVDDLTRKGTRRPRLLTRTRGTREWTDDRSSSSDAASRTATSARFRLPPPSSDRAPRGILVSRRSIPNILSEPRAVE